MTTPVPARTTSRLGWGAVVAIYLALTVVNTWPLFQQLGTGLPNDTGDPGLIAWVLWWNAHAVPLTQRWWNAPLFYPLPGALALSETFLGMTPFTSPLMWAGASAVTAYNLLYVVSFPAAAVAAHALAKRLTGRHDAALIAGLAFGFSPYRASQMPHLHLLVTCWMPLGLLALHEYLSSRRWTALLLFGICWLMNGFTTGYYLFFFAVLVGLWMLWFVRRPRDWIAIGIAGTIATIPIFPMLVGYNHYQAALGFSRNFGEIEAFSADLSGFWAMSTHVWVPYHWSFQPNPEGELYPGFMILLLTIVGAVAAWRAHPSIRRLRIQMILAAIGLLAAAIALVSWMVGGVQFSIAGLQISVTRQHRTLGIGIWFLLAAMFCDRRVLELWRKRSLFFFYVLAAAIMAVLAMGPIARAFGVRFMYPAPYAWLMALPGGYSLRVPARFTMLAILCLAQAAALAWTRLRPNGARAPVLAVVALAVFVDGWTPKLQVAPVPAPVTLSGLDTSIPVLELPMRDLYSDTAAMLRATVHGHPVVNGFSGYGPPHYFPLMTGLGEGDPSIFAAFQQFGPLAVLVNRADDPTGAHQSYVSQAPDAEFVYKTPVGSVYRFPARPPLVPPADEQPLAIASIDASVNAASALTMLDGQMTTQWQTHEPQQTGDELVITFDRAVHVGRIEMDLGEFSLNYPRRLRMLVDGAAPGAEQTVWEGGTAGYALIGAFKDRLRTPLTIFLPPSGPTHRLILRLLAAEKTYFWSIAELHIFGKPE